VRRIAQDLAKIDKDYADKYLKNGQKFAAELDSLAEEFKKVVEQSPNRKIVTIHEVFNYLAEYTGLEIVATVESEPGQEPSAGQMMDLLELLKRERPAGIFLEPQFPAESALTIAKEANIPVYTLDPVANGPENASKDYYFNTMMKNLETLRKALQD